MSRVKRIHKQIRPKQISISIINNTSNNRTFSFVFKLIPHIIWISTILRSIKIKHRMFISSTKHFVHTIISNSFYKQTVIRNYRKLTIIRITTNSFYIFYFYINIISIKIYFNFITISKNIITFFTNINISRYMSYVITIRIFIINSICYISYMLRLTSIYNINSVWSN